MGPKDDTGKSMKNAMYIFQYANRHLSRCQTAKQLILYIALAVVKLCLFEGVSQAVSQAFSWKYEIL